jgi:hypothetical protein
MSTGASRQVLQPSQKVTDFPAFQKWTRDLNVVVIGPSVR